ncbi:MAG: YMGG-like glycine zipper-containing protein [Pseudomonadales bacterium]
MTRIGVFILAVLPFGSAAASDLFIYPKAGQSPEQQSSDEKSCSSWALDQSGIDPLSNPQTPQQPETQRGRGLRGAAAGAAVGAIVGNSDDAAKGAAIGGLFGSMRQSSTNRSREQQYEQERNASDQAEQAKRDAYRRAYTACLEARDYTVK